MYLFCFQHIRPPNQRHISYENLLENNFLIPTSIVTSKITKLCPNCLESDSQGGPKTHPKLVKSSFGAPTCPRKCPCDLWMTKKLIQDTRKEPPSPQRDTSEYRKVIPTRIPNALKCENQIMTSKLRNFEIEEMLNRDFNLKVILSNRQPFNPISKSKKR